MQVQGKQFSHLLILGGAGRAGQSLVREALASGYRVTALLRNPQKLEIPAHPQLNIVKGDVTDQCLLQKLLAGKVDAVLSTLGIYIKHPGTPLADMTAPLVRLMEQQGVQRLICMSSHGVGGSRKQGSLLVKFITGITLRHVLVDKQRQEEIIERSGLAWTILRPPRILDSDQSRAYQRWMECPDPPRPRWQISKQDAALEMLALLEDDSSVRQVWHISY